jgi:hypothetical protein
MRDAGYVISHCFLSFIELAMGPAVWPPLHIEVLQNHELNRLCG